MAVIVSRTVRTLRADIAAQSEVLRTIDAGIASLRDEQQRIAAEQRDDLARSLSGLREELARSSAGLREEMGRTLTEQSMQQEQKLDNIRKSMEERIGAMQEGNERQLGRMRETVDEKLQETLNRRISESFRTVQEQLGKVSEGLGEMQTLAADVGGLKNVLSNVKTKGILGEYQLAAILEEILSPEQYEKDIATKQGSADRVEFAIKLPGDSDAGGGRVYLPIDAKFPSIPYEQLTAAYEQGDATLIDEARKALARSAKQSARTIHEKYIGPPDTTDFAIMFLPTEGLYAEVVNMGLIEELQRLYRVNIAGPTTMAALLNSLQMGFRTLAIQKRSSEVWNVLASVKAEFGKFESVLNSARNRMRQADDDLEKLIGTRTNAINRKLRSVSALTEPEEPAETLLPDGEAHGAEVYE
ncbi:MAG: DNA recombination protein RmuC [Clostridiales Family XIII bacterium]|nr:DNA recombination protein RmuC [Clostridiales Family XIII bacterium]